MLHVRAVLMVVIVIMGLGILVVATGTPHAKTWEVVFGVLVIVAGIGTFVGAEFFPGPDPTRDDHNLYYDRLTGEWRRRS